MKFVQLGKEFSRRGVRIGRIKGMSLEPQSARPANGCHESAAVCVCKAACLFSFPPSPSRGFSFRSFCKQAPGDTQLHSPGDCPLECPPVASTDSIPVQWISALSWLERLCTTLFYWHNEERTEKGLKWENHFHADWIKRTKELLAVAAFNLSGKKGSHLMAHNRTEQTDEI